MKEIDFERASLLMDVLAKVANVGVMNTPIASEAGLELQQINEDCRQNALERADQRRQEEADREADTQAQLRTDNPLEEAEVEEYNTDVDPAPRPAPILRRPL